MVGKGVAEVIQKAIQKSTVEIKYQLLPDEFSQV